MDLEWAYHLVQPLFFLNRVTMFKLGTANIIKKNLEEIFDSGGIISNYFSLDLVNTEYLRTDFSLILRKTYSNFSRLYFLSKDIDDLKKTLQKVQPVSVVNIPTRDDITLYDEILTVSGYSLYKVYETYYNNNIHGNDIFQEQFAGVEDIERVKYLLYSKLNVYTDHLPDDDDLLKMIKNKQVMVNFENNEICGIFIFSLQGKKCYFNFWVDIGKNGLFLIYNMYNYLKQEDIKYAYLWVDNANKKVIGMHKLMGCKPNGDKDYVYVKF